MRTILVSDAQDPMEAVATCARCHVWMSRPVKMGEARRTAMAHVKSAIETDASSAL